MRKILFVMPVFLSLVACKGNDKLGRADFYSDLFSSSKEVEEFLDDSQIEKQEESVK